MDNKVAATPVERMAELGHRLTPRQLELALLIAHGLTNDEIARRMQIDKQTVDTHRTRVMDALGLRNNVELCRYMIRLGFVEP